MMELKILAPEDGGFAREIVWNNEELKRELAARMAEYDALVLTEDQVKEGKKELAALRKLRTAMDDERKRIKKQYLDPYQKFEAQIKEVIALVDAPIQLIDRQIKEFDEQKRIEKMNQIHEIYDQSIGTLRGILPFERVLDEKWLNATASLKSTEKAIHDLVDRVNSDLDTIEALGSRYDMQIRDVYIRTLDLSTALREKSRLEEQEKQLAERRAAQEREQAIRKEQEAREREQEETRRKAEAARQEDAEKEKAPLAPEETAVPEEPRYVVALEVYGSRAQLEAFQAFLQQNGITYRTTAKARRI